MALMKSATTSFSIQENAEFTVMQVNVTYKGYGIWDDQIFVVYQGTTEFVERRFGPGGDPAGESRFVVSR